MRKRNVGLIGAGYWSTHHLNAWKRILGVDVTALCDRSPEKLRRAGEAYGVPEERRYGNVDDMLRDADIDIVDVVTGPETHPELVAKAAAAGKHMMCQKPFAASLTEAERMVRAAEANGVRLMVTENWRWLQPMQLLKRVLDSGELGELRVCRYIHTDFYTPRMAPGIALPQPFFRDMPRLLFYEMGAHWFDTMRFFFGQPKRLYAETRRVSPHIAGEDSGVVTLGYDEFYVVMDMSWATRRELDGPLPDRVLPDHREQLVIEGSLATVKLRFDGTIVRIDDRGNETTIAERTELDHGESHFRLQSHFIECLDTGRPFQTSGEDNLRTLELMFAVYESAMRHEAVRLT